jgi:hypothetical protein
MVMKIVISMTGSGGRRIFLHKVILDTLKLTRLYVMLASNSGV